MKSIRTASITRNDIVSIEEVLENIDAPYGHPSKCAYSALYDYSATLGDTGCEKLISFLKPEGYIYRTRRVNNEN